MLTNILVIVILVAVAVLAALQFRRGSGQAGFAELNARLEEMRVRMEAQEAGLLLKQQQLIGDTRKEINGNLQGLIQSVNANLSQSQKNLTDQLHNANTVIGQVQQKLGVLEKTAQNIEDVSRDITSLQDLLKSPKLRGNIGEYLLEDILRQVLPAENWQMKYSVKNGTQVDAVIKFREGVIPVDSKFPLESFQRMVGQKDEAGRKQERRELISAVKKQVDSISQKYINPEEKTFDFALMYIPAENVYYEVIVSDSLSAESGETHELFNYALKKRVVPVSPNTFYSYLMTIFLGLRGMRIEERARQIMDGLGRVTKDFDQVRADFAVAGTHLRNAVAKFDEGSRRADKLQDKLAGIVEPPQSLPGEK
jgi:DNA recombination protein RmuC